jgi:hypothetical protein
MAAFTELPFQGVLLRQGAYDSDAVLNAAAAVQALFAVRLALNYSHTEARAFTLAFAAAYNEAHRRGSEDAIVAIGDLAVNQNLEGLQAAVPPAPAPAHIDMALVLAAFAAADMPPDEADDFFGLEG